MGNNYETLVRWYLRFNRYLSVENFVVHEHQNGQVIGAIAIAVAGAFIVLNWRTSKIEFKGEKEQAANQHVPDVEPASPPPSENLGANTKDSGQPFGSRRDSPFTPVVGDSDPENNGAVPSCAKGERPTRLSTGQRIEPSEGIGGLSELTLRNGTERDAAVRLVSQDSSRTTRFVYIRAGDSETLVEIEPGTYTLRFILGQGWLPACHDFQQSDYFESGKPLVFTDDGEHYDVIDVTLNPVLEGNLRRMQIDKRHFFEGDQFGSASRLRTKTNY